MRRLLTGLWVCAALVPVIACSGTEDADDTARAVTTTTTERPPSSPVRIRGPVQGGAGQATRSVQDLVAAGYVEEEYFFAGVRVVWMVDRARRTVEVYTSPDQRVTLTESDTLDGGDVLPGLKLPVRDVFARVPKPKRPAAKQKRRRP